jgi:hypothetical protein
MFGVQPAEPILTLPFTEDNNFVMKRRFPMRTGFFAMFLLLLLSILCACSVAPNASTQTASPSAVHTTATTTITTTIAAATTTTTTAAATRATAAPVAAALRIMRFDSQEALFGYICAVSLFERYTHGYVPRNLYENQRFVAGVSLNESSIVLEYIIDNDILPEDPKNNDTRRADYIWQINEEGTAGESLKNAVERLGDLVEPVEYEGNTYYVGTVMHSSGIAGRYEYLYLYDDEFFWVGVPALGTVEEMLPYALVEKVPLRDEQAPPRARDSGTSAADAGYNATAATTTTAAAAQAADTSASDTTPVRR